METGSSRPRTSNSGVISIPTTDLTGPNAFATGGQGSNVAIAVSGSNNLGARRALSAVRQYRNSRGDGKDIVP